MIQQMLIASVQIRFRIFLLNQTAVYWIGTFGGGLNKVIVHGNPINQKLKFISFKFDINNPYSISDNRVYKIFRSKDGLFWIGTFGGGLNCFNPANGKFNRYPINSGSEDKFNIENFMTIFEDSDWNFMVGILRWQFDKF